MRKPFKRTPENRGSPESRGYDKAWFVLRARHLRANPLCLMCYAKGIETKAEHVDHVTSIKQRPDLRLDPANLQSLCGPHHDFLTATIDSGDLRGACDVNGDPLDPAHPWAQPTPEAALAAANAPYRPNHSPPAGLTRLLKRRGLGARQ